MKKLKDVCNMTLPECRAEMQRIMNQRVVEGTEGGEALSPKFRARRDQLAQRLYYAGELTKEQQDLYDNIGISYKLTLDPDSMTVMSQMVKAVSDAGLMDPEVICAFREKNVIPIE